MREVGSVKDILAKAKVAETKAEKPKGDSDEFKKALDLVLGEKKARAEEHGLKLSHHAAKRLHDRNLHVDGDEFLKLRGAMDKLKSKGGKDSLVITGQGAYIVDVDKSTVVTALDKKDMSENVFTKIDSTLFVN